MAAYKQVDTTERQLERFNVAAAKLVSTKELFNDPQITKFKTLPYMVDEMAIQLTDFVWAEHLGPIHIEYPATWWDAFKIRWFPKRLLSRWPANKTVRNIEFHAAYPEFRPAFGGDQKCVIHLTDYTV